MLRRLNKKGQSTLEYILVWTCIVAALVAAAATGGTGGLYGGVKSFLDTLGTKISSEAARISTMVK